MIIGILQPGYLPWLGFFEQMYRSDVFVMYDDIQYDKEGWRNRNRIKTANGIQWLTVPVHVRFESHPLIKDIKIDNGVNWRKKHLASIRQNYLKTTFFEDYINLFEYAYEKEWDYLVDIDIYFITKIAECLGMGGKNIVRSSTLSLKEDKIDRLINICNLYGAETFYEGASGKNYIDEKRFSDHGIKLEYQNYRHPVYRQLYGDFVPYLSVVDLLFNHGHESLGILTDQGRKGVEGNE
jgi:hypothetical protein